MSEPGGRQRVAIEPPTAQRLHRFPTSEILTTKAFHRAHRTALGPWYFGSDGSGRFDLPAPDGTCYLAESRAAALRETLGPRLVAVGVERDELSSRVVSTLHLPADVEVANTTAARAANHGITRELSTITPYDLPHAWAQAWSREGLGGVRYMGRLSTATSSGARCLAVFGAAGAGPAQYLPDRAPGSAIDTARRAGIRILDTPSTAAGLTVLTPPNTRTRP